MTRSRLLATKSCGEKMQNSKPWASKSFEKVPYLTLLSWTSYDTTPFLPLARAPMRTILSGTKASACKQKKSEFRFLLHAQPDRFLRLTANGLNAPNKTLQFQLIGSCSEKVFWSKLFPRCSCWHCLSPLKLDHKVSWMIIPHEVFTAQDTFWHFKIRLCSQLSTNL